MERTRTHPDARILRILVVAAFVVILNETTMVNAIPQLMDQFAVSARDAQWLSTAFMLTMAAIIPLTGWFLQRVSTRHAFGIAMGLFCTGTLLAALAWGFPVLLLARVVQASGTAVMFPLLMTSMLTLVAVEQRGKVMGNVTMVIAIAPALGPAISGLVLEVASWRWIFGVVLPIAAAITVRGLARLVDLAEPNPSTVDWPSAILAAGGFGSLVYGLSNLGGPTATAVSPPMAIVVGVVAVVAFGRRQIRLQRGGAPLLDLRTLRYGTFAVSLGVMSMAFMALMGAMILLPIYLQEVRGFDTLTTGLMMMPGGLAMGLLGPRVGRLYDRHGPRVLVVPGAAVMVAALASYGLAGPATPGWWLLLLHVAVCVGLAFVFTPVFTAGLAVLPPQLYPHGSAMLGTLQQVAAATGTAVVVTVMSSRAANLARDGSETAAALGSGIQWAFGVAAIIAVVVLALSVLLPRRVPNGPAPAGGPDESEPSETRHGAQDPHDHRVPALATAEEGAA